MTTTATTSISRAGPSDVPAIAGLLARAFADDPVLGWVVPDATRRERGLPAVFAAFAERYVPHRETYVAGDGVAAALWLPAGSQLLPEEEAEAFAERLGAAVGEDAPRAFELDALLEEHHPDEPCVYLHFMGVAPEHQGRGLGSRLLTTVLQDADARGTPAYLEATSVHNRRLYARHGFEVVGAVELPDGPTIWRMWRDPRPRR